MKIFQEQCSGSLNEADQARVDKGLTHEWNLCGGNPTIYTTPTREKFEDMDQFIL